MWNSGRGLLEKEPYAYKCKLVGHCKPGSINQAGVTKQMFQNIAKQGGMKKRAQALSTLMHEQEFYVRSLMR